MQTVSFAKGRYSPKTQILYTQGWGDFAGWCDKHDIERLPAAPEDIADFLTERARRLSWSTISGRMAAISAAHRDNGHGLKTRGTVVADAMAEIRRIKGTAGTPKDALTTDEIVAMLRVIPPKLVMHRAVILFAFASLMRRGEIAALNVGDVRITDTAAHITIRRSKTDKAGKGHTIAIKRYESEFCPVKALEAWLEQSGITSGALFRTHDGGRIQDRRVAVIAKRWAKKIGLDPRRIGAHSFRRGGITTMFRNGAKLEDIMRVSRHVTPTIALGYVEAHQAERNPATAALGL
jgi:integrase